MEMGICWKYYKKACNLLRFCFTITLKKKAISYHLSCEQSPIEKNSEPFRQISDKNKWRWDFV